MNAEWRNFVGTAAGRCSTITEDFMRRFSLVVLLAAATFVFFALGSIAWAVPPSGPFTHIKLRNLGPAAAGGRVTSVVGIPGNPNVYYIGAAAGGLWKTTNGGDSWHELFKHGDSASIGAVALAPSNPNDVWVGTGEANPRNDITTGHGIYFSPDGGKNWVFKGLADGGQIARIVINPTNPDIVYVAVLGNVWKPGKVRGIYMTTDGGGHWKRVLYVNATTGASAVVMDPQNPNVLFAGLWTVQRKPWTLVNGSTAGGIWRSIDGGRTWKKLTHGLPRDVPTNRVGLAIAPSDPNIVYALMANKHGLLYRSDDMGKHWREVSDNYAIDVRPFYFSVIEVSPNNPNQVYFGGSHLRESIDGGKTSRVIDRGVHPDHHALWIDPRNPERIIQGNDGGVYVSVNGGKHWRYLDNLPLEQFYTVAIDPTRPFGVCGGLQDNSAACGPSNSLSAKGIPGAAWWSPVGGDGIYAVAAPSDPNLIYADSQKGFIVRVNRKTWTALSLRPYTPTARSVPVSKLKYRFNWAAPLAVSPTAADTVYLGANVLFQSTDGGVHWRVISPDLTRDIKAHQPLAGGPVNHDLSGAENTDTILSIAIAPTDPKVIWVGTDDGLVWVTRDTGKHWSKVAPSVPSAARWGRISQIGVSPFSAGTAYLTVDAHMLGDPRPYVFKTADYGRHWTRIDRGLPRNHPAFVVREDPNRRGLLALGTDTGLYFSFTGGSHWTRMTGNLPTMPVWDLQFTRHPHDLVLATHGRGLWVFDNLQALENWGPAVAKSGFHLFAASTGIEWGKFNGKYVGYLGEPQAFVAPNPPSGPMLAYWLAKPVKPAVKASPTSKGPITISVRDRAGNPVANFHGPGKAGINRLAWNMRYTGAKLPKFMERSGQKSSSNRGGGPTGPLVLPGTYRVKVTVGKLSAEQTVVVGPDPRLHILPAVRQVGLRAALGLRNEVNAAVKVLERVHTINGILERTIASSGKAASASPAAGVHAAAVKLKQQLGALAMHFYNPNKPQYGRLHFVARFGERLYGLYQTVNYRGPNQAPNVEQRRLMMQFHHRLAGYLGEFNGRFRGAIKRYNRKAYAAGFGTLPVGTPIAVKPIKLP